jgi:hypothetical protein
MLFHLVRLGIKWDLHIRGCFTWTILFSLLRSAEDPALLKSLARLALRHDLGTMTNWVPWTGRSSRPNGGDTGWIFRFGSIYIYTHTHTIYIYNVYVYIYICRKGSSYFAQMDSKKLCLLIFLRMGIEPEFRPLPILLETQYWPSVVELQGAGHYSL